MLFFQQQHPPENPSRPTQKPTRKKPSSHAQEQNAPLRKDQDPPSSPNAPRPCETVNPAKTKHLRSTPRVALREPRTSLRSHSARPPRRAFAAAGESLAQTPNTVPLQRTEGPAARTTARPLPPQRKSHPSLENRRRQPVFCGCSAHGRGNLPPARAAGGSLPVRPPPRFSRGKCRASPPLHSVLRGLSARGSPFRLADQPANVSLRCTEHGGSGGRGRAGPHSNPCKCKLPKSTENNPQRTPQRSDSPQSWSLDRPRPRMVQGPEPLDRSSSFAHESSVAACTPRAASSESCLHRQVGKLRRIPDFLAAHASNRTLQ